MPAPTSPRKGLKRRIMRLLNTIPFGASTGTLFRLTGTRCGRGTFWKQLISLESAGFLCRVSSAVEPSVKWASLKWPTVYVRGWGKDAGKLLIVYTVRSTPSTTVVPKTSHGS